MLGYRYYDWAVILVTVWIGFSFIVVYICVVVTLFGYYMILRVVGFIVSVGFICHVVTAIIIWFIVKVPLCEFVIAVVGCSLFTIIGLFL